MFSYYNSKALFSISFTLLVTKVICVSHTLYNDISSITTHKVRVWKVTLKNDMQIEEKIHQKMTYFDLNCDNIWKNTLFFFAILMSHTCKRLMPPAFSRFIIFKTYTMSFFILYFLFHQQMIGMYFTAKFSVDKFGKHICIEYCFTSFERIRNLWYYEKARALFAKTFLWHKYWSSIKFSSSSKKWPI